MDFKLKKINFNQWMVVDHPDIHIDKRFGYAASDVTWYAMRGEEVVAFGKTRRAMLSGLKYKLNS